MFKLRVFNSLGVIIPHENCQYELHRCDVYYYIRWRLKLEGGMTGDGKYLRLYEGAEGRVSRGTSSMYFEMTGRETLGGIWR